MLASGSRATYSECLGQGLYPTTWHLFGLDHVTFFFNLELTKFEKKERKKNLVLGAKLNSQVTTFCKVHMSLDLEFDGSFDIASFEYTCYQVDMFLDSINSYTLNDSLVQHV